MKSAKCKNYYEIRKCRNYMLMKLYLEALSLLGFG
jgi:hypothetical protein